MVPLFSTFKWKSNKFHPFSLMSHKYLIYLTVSKNEISSYTLFLISHKKRNEMRKNQIFQQSHFNGNASNIANIQSASRQRSFLTVIRFPRIVIPPISGSVNEQQTSYPTSTYCTNPSHGFCITPTIAGEFLLIAESGNTITIPTSYTKGTKRRDNLLGTWLKSTAAIKEG